MPTSPDTAASRTPAAATDNQAASWLNMRRTANWQALETKPDGRHLIRAKDACDVEAIHLDRNQRECVERSDAAAAAMLAVAPSLVADRRAARRYSATQVRRPFTIAEGLLKSLAVLRDISTTGIRVVLGVQHPLGTSLQLDITSKSHGIINRLQVHVVRLVRLPDGQWLTGCAFLMNHSIMSG